MEINTLKSLFVKFTFVLLIKPGQRELFQFQMHHIYRLFGFLLFNIENYILIIFQFEMRKRPFPCSNISTIFFLMLISLSLMNGYYFLNSSIIFLVIVAFLEKQQRWKISIRYQEIFYACNYLDILWSLHQLMVYLS
jgi:hypothetical protein